MTARNEETGCGKQSCRLPNTAMIFATSTPLMEGLKGRVTNAGQKNRLIYLNAKPHLPVRSRTTESEDWLTGMSMRSTAFFVSLFPRTNSDSMSPRNSKIIQATDAGKETPARSIMRSTPKQKAKTANKPMGTYIQATMDRLYAGIATLDRVRL